MELIQEYLNIFEDYYDELEVEKDVGFTVQGELFEITSLVDVERSPRTNGFYYTMEDFHHAHESSPRAGFTSKYQLTFNSQDYNTRIYLAIGEDEYSMEVLQVIQEYIRTGEVMINKTIEIGRLVERVERVPSINTYTTPEVQSHTHVFMGDHVDSDGSTPVSEHSEVEPHPIETFEVSMRIGIDTDEDGDWMTEFQEMPLTEDTLTEIAHNLTQEVEREFSGVMNGGNAAGSIKESVENSMQRLISSFISGDE